MDIEVLRKRKKELKMTFDEMSEKSGIPKRTLEAIFVGKTKTPRIDTIEAIEKALGLNNDTPLPQDIMRLIDAISTLSDEECEEVSKFIDFVVSKRKQR